MGQSGLLPTQKQVYADDINDFARQMAAGNWDWTRVDVRNPLLLGPNSEILNGHHRFIAAELAGVKIPEGVIARLTSSGRHSRSWSQVVVKRRPVP